MEAKADNIWIHIEKKLKCSEYWSLISFKDWNAIDYFMTVIESDPTINKRVANAALYSDLEVLYTTFAESREILKKVKQLQKQQSKKSDLLLTKFWEEKYTGLQEIAVEQKVNVVKTASYLQEKAVEKMACKRKQHFQSLSPTKRQDAKTIEQVENDGILIPGSSLTLGTIVKREALKIHEKLASKPTPLNTRQRKIMSAGLSSILDLTDQSYSSQRSLFETNQWNFINAYFDKKLELIDYPLDSAITDSLTIIEHTLSLSGDFSSAKKYIQKMKHKHEKNTTISSTLSIIKHVLKIMDQYDYLLAKPPKFNIRESDYLRIVWSPILELLFPPKGKARVVTGESEYPLTTKQKNELYPSSNNIHGFKIDVRVVVDIGQEEIDLAVGECAKDDDNSKAIKDGEKLLRESKDATDGIIQNTVDADCRMIIYFMQFSGTSCSLSTTELVANGLYVSKHRHSFNFPANPSDLSSFSQTLSQLLTMKREVNFIADKVLQKRKHKHSIESAFNRESVPEINSKLAWIRDTWYTPPPGEASALPRHCFGPPPPSILERLKDAKKDETKDKVEFDKVALGENQPDLYGWIKLADNTYYNIYLKKKQEKHPFLE